VALYTPKEEPVQKQCAYGCVCHKSIVYIGVVGSDLGASKGSSEVSTKVVVAWPISGEKETNVVLEQ